MSGTKEYFKNKLNMCNTIFGKSLHIFSTRAIGSLSGPVDVRGFVSLTALVSSLIVIGGKLLL